MLNHKKDLHNKIFTDERITPAEAVELFRWDIAELMEAADERRRRAVPGDRVGFIIDRIINYSNICEAKCTFCAFHADAGVLPSFELSTEEILTKIEELVNASGLQVMLQGGLHPEHSLDWYTGLIVRIREQFPELYLHSFSPAEVHHIAKKDGCSVDTVVKRLKAAGVNSIPGASDLLVDSVRENVSPRKCSRYEWREVIHALHANGMTSTATMTYGMGESIEDRIEHLDFIRSTQDETENLKAFIPWSFSPANTRLADVPKAGKTDYLKIVAVSRIFLDNIKNIQAGWLTEGHKQAQLALQAGANDMGGVLTEELVVMSTGVTTHMTVEDILKLIRETGKIPVLRDSRYNAVCEYTKESAL